MMFSTKTEYGLRAVLWLARHWGRKSCPLSEIAKDEGISRGYLEKLAGLLKRANILTAQKGVKGGYALARSPSHISLEDVVEALEGRKSRPFQCPAVDEDAQCTKEQSCVTKHVWVRIAESLNAEMSKVMLSDLLWK